MIVHDSETELPEELRSLLADARRGQQEWIDGIEGAIAQRQHEAMTIYGPFGGPAVRMGEGLPQVQAAIRAQFRGGNATMEMVRAITADDLVVLVVLETSTVNFAGKAEAHQWSLRTTEVYQRAGDSWLRIHRHADPLVKRRPFVETLALLEG